MLHQVTQLYSTYEPNVENYYELFHTWSDSDSLRYYCVKLNRGFDAVRVRPSLQPQSHDILRANNCVFSRNVCTIPVTIPKHPHTFSEDESVNLRWRVRLRKSRNLSIELRRSADCSLMTRSRQFGGSWVVSHVVSAVIPLALPLCSADKQFGIQEAQTHGGCRSRAHRAKCSAKFVLVRWNEMLRSFGGMWGNSWGYDGVTSIWNRVLKDGRCSCNARATIPDGATEA